MKTKTSLDNIIKILVNTGFISRNICWEHNISKRLSARIKDLRYQKFLIITDERDKDTVYLMADKQREKLKKRYQYLF